MAYKKPTYVSVLSRSHAVDILSYMYENEPIVKSDLYAVSSNYRAFCNTVELLIEDGYILEKMEAEPKLHYDLTLTPRGKAVGKLLYEARKVRPQSIR